MMSEVLTPIVYQLGVGGIGGFIAGYEVKKIAKIIAVILGIFFLLLVYPGYTGVISVNYERLTEAVSKALPVVKQAP